MCNFHVGQSCLCAIQGNSIRQEYSTKNLSWECKFKSSFKLSYFDRFEVPQRLNHLVIIAPKCVASSELIQYVESNYVALNAPAGEPSHFPRSNNRAESFQCHYSSMFYSPRPKIHLILKTLLEIQ